MISIINEGLGEHLKKHGASYVAGLGALGASGLGIDAYAHHEEAGKHAKLAYKHHEEADKHHKEEIKHQKDYSDANRRAEENRYRAIGKTGKKAEELDRKYKRLMGSVKKHEFLRDTSRDLKEDKFKKSQESATKMKEQYRIGNVKAKAAAASGLIGGLGLAGAIKGAAKQDQRKTK